MEKIESQLVRVRWFNRCLIACMVLSLGVWFISKTFGPETAWAQSGAKVIRANGFALEDENGKTRASLSVFKDGPNLALMGENGKICAGLSLREDGADLRLNDENGNPRAVLGYLKDKGSALVLTDENRNPIWSAP